MAVTEPGVVRGDGDGRAARTNLHVLRRAVPGRDVHHPHEAAQPLLRHQPHLSLPAHLRRLVPRLLPAGGIRREGQPRDHHPPGARRLPADRRRDAAADARRDSSARWVVRRPGVPNDVMANGVTIHFSADVT